MRCCPPHLLVFPLPYRVARLVSPDLWELLTRWAEEQRPVVGGPLGELMPAVQRALKRRRAPQKRARSGRPQLRALLSRRGGKGRAAAELAAEAGAQRMSERPLLFAPAGGE